MFDERPSRQVAFATMKKLVEVKGISEVNAQKIQQAASKLIPMGFQTVYCAPLTQ